MRPWSLPFLILLPLAASAVISCDGRLKSSQTPITTAAQAADRDAGLPAVDAAAISDAGDAAKQPQTVERWACSRTNGSVVFQHAANLVLRDDGTFELHHTNASQFGGWMTWLQGTWTRDETNVLVLTPVSALRRKWIGDAHRKIHGENVDVREKTETVSTTPWHLRSAADGTLFISEVQTHVGRLRPGAERAMPCDDVPATGR